MILCTICARDGSKGVKNKNIRRIDGLELIVYSILQARESGLFEHIVISTDSDEIASVAIEYGGEVFFKREAAVSSDSVAKVPTIRDTPLRSEEHFKMRLDTLVDLDAIAPLRTSEDIKKACKLFKNGDYESLITAVPARCNPYFNLTEEQKKGGYNTSKLRSFVCRQEAPKCYDMNTSIYIFDREGLLKRDDVFDTKTVLYAMSKESAFDIDSEPDSEIVEFLLRERRLNARR